MFLIYLNQAAFYSKISKELLAHMQHDNMHVFNSIISQFDSMQV